MTTHTVASRSTHSLLQVEGIGIDEESLAFLGEVGERTSLRHAVQLLTPAMMLARTNGRDAISKGDLEVGALPRCLQGWGRG